MSQRKMAARKFAPSVLIIIFYLLFFMFDQGNCMSKTTEEHDHDHQQELFSGGENINIQQVVGHSGDNHMDHIKASKIGFFTADQLFVGKTMPISFLNIDFSSLPRFLPKREADIIPFTSHKLPQILEFFSFPQESLQANQIEMTLKTCELKPIKGETKFCATSFESLLDFVGDVFGKENHYKVVTPQHITNPIVQNYTFLEISQVFSSSNKMVACHIMPYPYAVFYCHSPKASKLFKIRVGGNENGDRVEGVSVCHMDTSDWISDDMFILLGVKRGTPICHFFSRANLIWVSY